MPPTRPLLTAAALALVLAFPGRAAAQEKPGEAQQSESPTDKLQASLLSAGVGALLGFTANFILARRKERRDPRSELAGDIRIVDYSPSFNPVMSKGIAVTYRGEPLKDVVYVECDVLNSGNQIVKNHTLRFQFEDEVRLLEPCLSPEPEEECGVQQKEGSLKANSVAYTLGTLQPGQQVHFRFIVTGKAEPTLKVISTPDKDKKDNTPVEFVPRSLARGLTDSEGAAMFAMFLLLYWFAPMLLSPLSDFLGNIPGMLIAVFRIVLAFPIIGYSPQFLRVLVKVLTTLTAPPATGRDFGQPFVITSTLGVNHNIGGTITNVQIENVAPPR